MNRRHTIARTYAGAPNEGPLAKRGTLGSGRNGESIAGVHPRPTPGAPRELGVRPPARQTAVGVAWSAHRAPAGGRSPGVARPVCRRRTSPLSLTGRYGSARHTPLEHSAGGVAPLPRASDPPAWPGYRRGMTRALWRRLCVCQRAAYPADAAERCDTMHNPARQCSGCSYAALHQEHLHQRLAR